MHSELFATLEVELGPRLNVGHTDQGFFKIIPIIGGTITGKLNGKIVPFGGDFNHRYDDRFSKAHALYLLKCNEELIYVDNQADIDKKTSSFTHLRFVADKNGNYHDLNYRTFNGKIVEGDDAHVLIEVYEVMDLA